MLFTIAYVLMIWIGDRQGYVVVNDIKDKAACEQLYERWRTDSIGYSYGKQHSCLPYDSAQEIR
jgi:hypothetical protein